MASCSIYPRVLGSVVFLRSLQMVNKIMRYVVMSTHDSMFQQLFHHPPVSNNWFFIQSNAKSTDFLIRRRGGTFISNIRLKSVFTGKCPNQKIHYGVSRTIPYLSLLHRQMMISFSFSKNSLTSNATHPFSLLFEIRYFVTTKYIVP